MVNEEISESKEAIVYEEAQSPASGTEDAIQNAAQPERSRPFHRISDTLMRSSSFRRLAYVFGRLRNSNENAPEGSSTGTMPLQPPIDDAAVPAEISEENSVSVTVGSGSGNIFRRIFDALRGTISGSTENVS